MLLLALPFGLLVGASLGALGGGGSILTVPVLVYALSQSTSAATTGSLVIVGLSALAGTVGHARAHHVRWGRGAVFGVLGIAGSYVGSRLNAKVDPHVLLSAFAGLMLVAAYVMWRRRATAPRAMVEHPKASEVPLTRRIDAACLAKMLGAATAVGLLTGFFGVGGGFVIVPALVLVLGFEMPVAIGTSLLVIAINAGSAFVSRLHTGLHADWLLLLAFTASAVAGTWIGGRIASRVSTLRLTTGFTVLLVVGALLLSAANLPAALA